MTPGERPARWRPVRVWAPAALYALVVSALSHQAALQPPESSPDWLLHGAEFLVLGALAGWAARATPALRRRGGLIAVGAGCLLFAILDEWHQSFVPGRSGAADDVLADAAGAIAGLAAAWAIGRRGGRKPVEVVLLGRPGCHLCDEAETVILGALAETGGELRKKNVDEDPDLRARYGDEIPVVLIDGRKRFKHRVDGERFRRAMRSRTGKGASG